MSRLVLTEELLSDSRNVRVLAEGVSHSQAMQYMKEILKYAKDDVVTVKFTKKNGETREMDVHFDEDFIRHTVKNANSETVLRIKKTNKMRDNMVVCEKLPDGTYQFRTIPLRNIISITH